ncbi:MAG: hypothetical protein MUF42_12170 [Cytophagaceae bacterium]|jgi:hypothetical protein|nr:hypothetical protein [Cytophagaceae bacterium]
MSEEFILSYLPRHIKRLGYKNYHLQYKDLVLQGGETITIESYNELHYVVGDPMGVVMESDAGFYDSTGFNLCDNQHIHKGEIKISNPGTQQRRVKFVQAIIVH